MTSNFSAESGTSSGAVVNHRHPQRHQELPRHGSTSTGATICCKTAPLTPLVKPMLRWNNFGWNLGGPVIIPKVRFNRDKEQLFFFVAEDLKILQHWRDNHLDRSHCARQER